MAPRHRREDSAAPYCGRSQTPSRAASLPNQAHAAAPSRPPRRVEASPLPAQPLSVQETLEPHSSSVCALISRRGQCSDSAGGQFLSSCDTDFAMVGASAREQRQFTFLKDACAAMGLGLTSSFEMCPPAAAGSGASLHLVEARSSKSATGALPRQSGHGL